MRQIFDVSKKGRFNRIRGVFEVLRTVDTFRRIFLTIVSAVEGHRGIIH